MLKTFFSLFLIFSSSLALGGYEDTNWGNSLKSIQQKYPNGKLTNNPNEPIEYSLTRTVAGYKNATIKFKFNQKKELYTVGIAFLDPMTNKDFAEKMKEDLKDKLQKKYKVEPSKQTSPDNDDFAYVWNLANNDLIILSKNSILKVGWALVIIYSNADNKDLKEEVMNDTKGL